jgi:hypothetical protein
MAEFHDLLGGFSETTNEVSVGGGKGSGPEGSEDLRGPGKS